MYCSENYCPHDHRFLSALVEEKDHQIFWFRLEGGDRLQEERALPEGVQAVHWSGLRKKQNWLDYPRLKKDFARVLEQIKPDIVHAGPVQRVALLPAMNAFHPLVTMSWGFDMLQDADRNPFWRMLTRYVLKKSDWLIADCHTVKNKARDFGFNILNSTIFPWGVDLHLFSPASRKAAKRTIGFENQFLVIHTRSWEPRYGVDIALQGFSETSKSHPNMHMLMLGGGSQSQTLRGFVDRNGLQDRVHFLGYQSNEKLAQYYQAGDVYLSASHVDGSSVALLEAMACGCVPVVSDIPSNLEWVQNGLTGWAFSDGSSDALAHTLQNAAKADLGKMQKAVRAKVEADADWEQGKKKLLHTYKQVIKSINMSENQINQDLNVVCIIQARMGSSRLPGKVIEPICGYPMLDWVVYRAKRAVFVSDVIVATTTDVSDDPIAGWCAENHVACFRGSVLDVLDRFYRAASSAKADIVVRLTADCPLVDPQVLDDVVALLLDNGADFAANRLPPPFHRTFPIGLDVEVVTFSALERAWREADQSFEREHVLPYLYEEEGRFKVTILDATRDLGSLRWTVDTKQDLDFIRALMSDLDCERDFSWLSIMDHLEKNPALMQINADVQHKSFTDIDHRMREQENDKHG